MRKQICQYVNMSIAFHLLFGWIFLFFCGVIGFTEVRNNIDTINLNSSKKLNGTSISYDEINMYNLQSQLMLRRDYFNQGLNPSDYAFSLVINIVNCKKFGNSKIDARKVIFELINYIYIYIYSWRKGS